MLGVQAAAALPPKVGHLVLQVVAEALQAEQDHF
jgi:hypothetical protein